MFYNNCLLYENIVTFFTNDVLDVSRVPVWLDWVKNNNNNSKFYISGFQKGEETYYDLG